MPRTTEKPVNYDGLIAAMGFDDEQFAHLRRSVISDYALALAALEESLGWCVATPPLAIQNENIWSFGICFGGTYTPPLGPNRRTAPQLMGAPFGPEGSRFKLGLELSTRCLTAVFRVPESNPYCIDTGRLPYIGLNGFEHRFDVVDSDGNVIGSGLTVRAACSHLSARR